MVVDLVRKFPVPSMHTCTFYLFTPFFLNGTALFAVEMATVAL